ncbi:hypothetical protein FD723_32985 (plasmid) [Nostoc sp. C052]|uniref:hypothetical protein n=1 Tax=Nostoc sp. C052 TaxID=2576902 RepID=UPI0015C3DE6E|nr:hypothetical protein [Nostoc sp. C052]QLE45148.1 hypothetical protein FD723_32985 [Nostoc sp. C052]
MKSAFGQPFKSPCSKFTANGRSPMSNRQPEKRHLKPLFFLDFIFWTFSEGKVGHLFLKGKVVQPVQNLLQVTISTFTNNYYY